MHSCTIKRSTKRENISACIAYNVFNKHKTECMVINGEQAIKMPEKGEKIMFQNYHKQLPVPFVIYADFEAITENVQGCKPIDDKSYTDAYQKRTDCGFGYKVVCCYDDKYTKPVQIYRSGNTVYKFMEKKCQMKYGIVKTRLKNISINH